MEKIVLKTRKRKLLADTITPVSIYLKLRDRFANSFLLESSDYHGAENSFSYICCHPLAYIKLKSDDLESLVPGTGVTVRPYEDLKSEIADFSQLFEQEVKT